MNLTKTLTPLLSIGGLLLVSVVWASQPYDRLLSDAELAAVSGRDPGTSPYLTNCAYTSLDEGQVAWRDCNGVDDNTHTECVYCDRGSVASGQPGDDNNVMKAAPMRCTPFDKYVGICVGGACVDRVLVGRCSGSITQYYPQWF